MLHWTTTERLGENKKEQIKLTERFRYQGMWDGSKSKWKEKQMRTYEIMNGVHLIQPLVLHGVTGNKLVTLKLRSHPHARNNQLPCITQIRCIFHSTNWTCICSCHWCAPCFGMVRHVDSENDTIVCTIIFHTTLSFTVIPGMYCYWDLSEREPCPHVYGFHGICWSACTEACSHKSHNWALQFVAWSLRLLAWIVGVQSHDTTKVGLSMPVTCSQHRIRWNPLDNSSHSNSCLNFFNCSTWTLVFFRSFRRAFISLHTDFQSLNATLSSILDVWVWVIDCNFFTSAFISCNTCSTRTISCIHFSEILRNNWNIKVLNTCFPSKRFTEIFPMHVSVPSTFTPSETSFSSARMKTTVTPEPCISNKRCWHNLKEKVEPFESKISGRMSSEQEKPWNENNIGNVVNMTKHLFCSIYQSTQYHYIDYGCVLISNSLLGYCIFQYLHLDSLNNHEEINGYVRNVLCMYCSIAHFNTNSGHRYHIRTAHIAICVLLTT